MMLIFEPGFSTVEKVNAISGRGVGMDVVRKSLESIGGNIKMESQLHQGTTFRLTLPASMAVKGTLLCEVSEEAYAIPLSYTQAVTCLYKKDIHKAGKGLVATYLDQTISIIFLQDLFSLPQCCSVLADRQLQESYHQVREEEKLHVVVVCCNNRTMGFVVDRFLQQKEIVEKPLMKPIDAVRFISGVTILGNGHVCLVLNVSAITNFIFHTSLNAVAKVQ